MIAAFNEDLRLNLGFDDIEDIADPQDARKLARLCKKNKRYDIDRVIRERYANLTWVEVTALYSREMSLRKSEVPDREESTGMATTAVNWVHVCDQVAQVLDLTEDQICSELRHYTDGWPSHGLIKSAIIDGRCTSLAWNIFEDKPLLMKLHQGPLGKPEHLDMHRRIDLLQQYFFSSITETDYLVRPELKDWAQEKPDDQFSRFKARREKIAEAAMEKTMEKAEKEREEERIRDDEWLKMVLSFSDEELSAMARAFEQEEESNEGRLGEHS